MEAMNLRRYQQEAYDAVMAAWAEQDKLLVVLPTGTGKTILFANVAARIARAGRKTLVLAHRDELIRQAQDKLYKACGLRSAIEKAGETSIGTDHPVVVGSVQTLKNRKRLEQHARDRYKTIIVDEAHHAISATYKRVLERFTSKVLGVTATPDRGDKKDLGTYFEALAYEYLLKDAIRDGWLVPIVAQTIPLDIDLRGLHVKRGDFDQNEADELLRPYLGGVIEKAGAILAERKTLVFLPLVKTSKIMTDLLNAAGIEARHVDGKSEDRDEVYRWFMQAPPGSVVCNSQLWTEGTDIPPIDCVMMLRPTKSRAMYAQCIGRGTRLHPGKKDLLLPDFLWHTERHALCRPCSLVAGDERIAELITQLQEKGGGRRLDDLEAEAERMALDEHQSSLARELEKNRRRKGRTIDPLSYGAWTHDEGILGYSDTFKWENDRPTPGQVQVLQRHGFDPTNMTKGYACTLINSIIGRNDKGLATPKQMRFLESHGYTNVGEMKREEASRIIDSLMKRFARHAPRR